MEIDDYIQSSGSLHLLFQLRHSPRSFGYLTERSALTEETLHQRIKQAKELGLIGERREESGIEYELDTRGTNLIGLLEDREDFDKKAYLEKRREIVQLQHTIEKLQGELADIVRSAGSIVADMDSLEEDEDVVRLETE